MAPQSRGCLWKEGIQGRINEWPLFMVGLLAGYAFSLGRDTFADGWSHFNRIIAEFQATLQHEPLIPAGAPLDHVPSRPTINDSR